MEMPYKQRYFNKEEQSDLFNNTQSGFEIELDKSEYEKQNWDIENIKEDVIEAYKNLW